MIRRPRKASGIVLALVLPLMAVTATSCATFTENDNVASVNDHDLTQETLKQMLDSELGQSLLGQAPIDGEVPGSVARSLISAWIVLNSLADAGLVTDEARTAAEADLIGQAGPAWDTAPVELQQLAIQNVVIGTAIQNEEISQDDFVGIVDEADVNVDSFYGAWDPEQLAVVAFG